MKYELDISVIITFHSDGPEVTKLMDELVYELEKLGRKWEILATDSAVKGNSIDVLRKYSDKYPNIFTIVLTHPGVPVVDKTHRYLLGYKMARGKYIINMDSDGQDVPAEMYKFIEKLDEGYDFVSGHKQKRKDGAFYMFSSKIANILNRSLLKVPIHDMNCGYKGWQAKLAKNIKLRGGLFRFLPAILSARKVKMTEVPVEHRERLYADKKFNFLSRLKGGIYDLITIYFVRDMHESPMYVFGAIAIFMGVISLVMLGVSILLSDLYVKLLFALFFTGALAVAFVSFLIGLYATYSILRERKDDRDFGILEIYPEHPNYKKVA